MSARGRRRTAGAAFRAIAGAKLARGARARARGGMLAAGLLAALLGPPAHADGVAVRVNVDNDEFNFWQAPGTRPDFGYTHGAEIALHVPRAPAGLAGLVPRALLGGAGGEGATPALELRLRQSIYSPWSLPPDRPYAGWLEIAIGVSRASALEAGEVLVHAGVTGPPSLAGTVQRWVHRGFESYGPPPDWSEQLPFEPGIGLEIAAARLAAAGEESGWRIAAGATGRVRAGTWADDLRLGLVLQLGYAPEPPGPGVAVRRGFSFAAHFTPRVDLVLRDEFLDGTLFRSFPGPGSRNVIAESETRAGIGWGGARLEYAVMRRSREFDAQPSPHTYSSIALSWQP